MTNIKTAEILCVGTELLLGDIVNTNAAFLSQRLAELGICVYKHTAVGDNPERLKIAIANALETSDLVITSGGLGPTYDDLTKETVAEYFSRPLYMHKESLEKIKNYFARTGRAMTKNNEKQAMMPQGATVLENNYGTAPALAICNEQENKTVIMLPGPPNELTAVFNEQVIPYLHSRSGSVIASKNIYLFGIGESALEDKIKHIMSSAQNPSVAPYCKEGEVRLRVTAKSDTKAQALEMCDEMIKSIYSTEIGKYIYGIDVDSLENALVTNLLKQKMTVCCAESLTGGLIGERITSISGSSAVFKGGCITYTNEMKENLLGVSHNTLEKFGAVSKETAMEMACRARELLMTDIAVSATGLAGPSGGTDDTPVGTVFIGISTKNGESYRMLSLSGKKSREYIRTVSASNALDMALKAIKELTNN